MKIYLAGPMRGIKDFNFPAFREAASHLRGYGHEVFNPAEADEREYGAGVSINPTGDENIAARKHGFSLRRMLKLDLCWICDEAEAVALLPGWQNSKGATAERATAIALGLKIIEL